MNRFINSIKHLFRVEKKIKLTNFEISILLITMILFFEPQLFKEEISPVLVIIDDVYKVLKMVFGVASLVIYFHKSGISKLFLSMIVFQLVACFSTLVNNGDLIRFFGPAITTLFVIAATECLARSNSITKRLSILLWYFRFLFVANVFSIPIIQSMNMDRTVYFLGIDNRWIFTFFPWLLLEFIYEIKVKKRLKWSFIAWAGTTASLFYVGSMAAAFCQLFWVVLFFPKIRDLITKTIYPFILVIIANFGISFFNIQYIVKDAFHLIGKDVTLSGRTYLWRHILNDSGNYIWLGRGMQTMAYDKDFFASSYDYKLPFLYVIHAHNSVFTILYRFGIFAVILYLYIIFDAFSNLVKNKSVFSSVIFVSLIIALVLSIFDTFDCAGFYMALALAGSAQIFVKNGGGDE